MRLADSLERWSLARLTAVGLVLQSALATVLLTWPTLVRLGGRVLGAEEADTLKHLWTLWWVRAHLLREGFGLHTELINQPVGTDLWPVEPLNGLAAVLLWWLPVVPVANLLAMANMTATGVAAGLLAWALTRDRLAAHAAGLLLQTSAWSLFALHVGVGELQHLWLLPLGIWALVRLKETLRWRWVLAVAGLLAMSVIACFYYGFYLALALVVVGAWGLVTGPRRPAMALRLLAAAGLAMAVAVPVTHAFSTSYGDPFDTSRSILAYVFGEGMGQVVVDPVGARLQPIELLAGRAAFWGHGLHDLEAYGGGRLLGIPMLLLGVAGLVRRPREGVPYAVIAVLGVLLALGSYLSSGGVEVALHGRHLRLPFLYLNRALAFVAEPINFPVRFLALTSVALAALGPLALDGRSTRWRQVLFGLAALNVVDVQVRGLLPWPLPGFQTRELGALAALDDPADPAGGEGAVLDLGASIRDDPESRHLCIEAQLVHGQPIQVVPIDRLEFHVRDGRFFAAGLRMVEDLSPVYRGVPGEAPPGDYRADLYMLRQAGFDRILVVAMGGRDPLSEPLRRGLDAAFGAPVLATPLAVTYRVPAVEGDTRQIEAWRAEHAARSEAARAASGGPNPMQPLGHEKDAAPGAPSP